MVAATRDAILEIVRRRGVIRARELSELAIPREYLTRLVEKGSLVRTARGVYRLPGDELSASTSLADAALKVPHGVICLLSALRFHEIGTQNPFEVWMAIDKRARKPALEYPPLRIVRLSGGALTSGIEIHHIDGVDVKVFSVEKTIVDCFKYRNKIGVDVAIEALRDAHRSRTLDMNDLWRFAEIDRVSGVVRPYIEAIV